jgi:hypothetical protein|tara:strand:- start:584 stop:724 length:141 start_codon:yes stop_codon:yes gene_type:complete
MKNISILQIIILTLLSILIFSDFSKIKKRLFDLLKKLNVKNRKKGS